MHHFFAYGYLNLLIGFEFQVPFLFGVTAFEKVASCVIHLIFRRTGRHLFLTDDDEGKPPLLKRMIEDYDECYFMYVCCLPHISFLFYRRFVSFKGSSCLSNDCDLLGAGLRCALSNVGLHTQMWAMIVSFIFASSF